MVLRYATIFGSFCNLLYVVGGVAEGVGFEAGEQELFYQLSFLHGASLVPLLATDGCRLRQR